MKITQIIAQLVKAKKKHGDIQVLRRYTNPKDGSVVWNEVMGVSYGKRSPIEENAETIGKDAEWISIE